MPKTIYIFLLLLVILSNNDGLAQVFEQELRDAIKTKPKAEFRMDSRHSFINQKGVKTVGFKIGMQFADKLSFGLGYNQLWSPLRSSVMNKGVQTEVELSFFTVSPYLEYVFFKDDKWELSIPVQFGFGSSYYLNKSSLVNEQLRKEFVVTYEPAITFQYRILKYFGAGLGIGYRFMIIPNRQLEEQFTSPVYIFKTRIYFQDILRDLNIY